jgi:hypothetical protein
MGAFLVVTGMLQPIITRYHSRNEFLQPSRYTGKQPARCYRVDGRVIDPVHNNGSTYCVQRPVELAPIEQPASMDDVRQALERMGHCHNATTVWVASNWSVPLYDAVLNGACTALSHFVGTHGVKQLAPEALWMFEQLEPEYVLRSRSVKELHLTRSYNKHLTLTEELHCLELLLAATV